MKKVLYILILCMLFVVVGCTVERDTFNKTEVSYITQRWNIQLPENGVLEYQRTTATFSGDGSRYFIIKYPDNSIENMITFEKEENQMIEDKMGHIRDEGWDEQTPLCPIPMFEEGYEWKIIDQEFDDLYLLYFPKQLKLYILDIHI